jgi:hypothetical protein
MGERGLQADLAELIAQDDVSCAGGEQLALEIFDDFVSPVDVQLQHKSVARRGPGRPPGSKTRTGLNIVQLIKSTKRPTLLALKEWADLPLVDFMKASGIEKPAEAFSAWFRIAELVTAYEEGRPTQRVELDGKVAVLPVVLFGDAPVRPDLVGGNPPEDGAMINVTDWEKRAKSDASPDGDDEGASPKAHEDIQGVEWSGQSDD